MVSISQIEANLVSEIGLSHVQARVYLLVTCHGKDVVCRDFPTIGNSA